MLAFGWRRWLDCVPVYALDVLEKQTGCCVYGAVCANFSSVTFL